MLTNGIFAVTFRNADLRTFKGEKILLEEWKVKTEERKMSGLMGTSKDGERAHLAGERLERLETGAGEKQALIFRGEPRLVEYQAKCINL